MWFIVFLILIWDDKIGDKAKVIIFCIAGIVQVLCCHFESGLEKRKYNVIEQTNQILIEATDTMKEIIHVKSK